MKTRKNKKLLVVVAMVLMIGLVAGMGAMTYSKYITTGETGTQAATAANWGFVVSVDATNLFASDYKFSAGTTATYNGAGALVVNGSGDAKVVAPGTSGSMTITINGSAEVNAKLTIQKEGDIEEIKYDNYYPVKWTLTDGSDTTIGTLQTVINALTSTSTVFAAGTPYNKTYTLSWEWAFETADVSGLNGANRNVEDSLIGYSAFGRLYSAIDETYIGTYQIPADSLDSDVETKYGNIVNQMSFKLLISVEQTQEEATP